MPKDNKWRFIASLPADGPQNMAFDEALFGGVVDDDSKPSLFRVYTWSAPCMTLGYFQKYAEFGRSKAPVTRRLTGGLAVSHGADISYCMVTKESDWDAVYDQETTYHRVHKCIKNAFGRLGFKTEFYPPAKAVVAGNSICVQTVFPYDLQMSGKKVVGSCQRRRGKTLLLEGSIHIKELNDLPAFCAALKRGFAEELNIEFIDSEPDARELEAAGKLRTGQYSSEEWNRKF